MNRNLEKIESGRVRPGMGIAPAVVLINPKYGHNAAAALRSCAAFDVRQLWISGDRVLSEWQLNGRLHREERMKSYGKTDVFLTDYPFDAFSDVTPVAVEIRPDAQSLTDFDHPEKAVYVFGPEDGGLGSVHARHCHQFVIIPSLHCLNLSTAVTVILADRIMKRQRAGLEPRRASYDMLDEPRGFTDEDYSLE